MVAIKNTASICYLKIILIEYLMLLKLRHPKSVLKPGRSGCSWEALVENPSTSLLRVQSQPDSLAPSPHSIHSCFHHHIYYWLLSYYLPFMRLWWLISCVILDAATGCHDIGQDMISECVYRSDFDEITFESVDWVKQDCPSPKWVGLIRSVEGLTR